MTDLAPFDVLRDDAGGAAIDLPGRLATLYGPLHLPQPAEASAPHVISNFVSTIDGIVALDNGGTSGGGEISGFDRHDRALMGLLRAVSDAVVVGAGTLRAAPRHLWNAARVFPGLSDEYRELRCRLGKSEEPLNVIVTAAGKLDTAYPVFNSDVVPALVVTTHEGARELQRRGLPSRVMVDADGGERVSADHIVSAIRGRTRATNILVEGGPGVMAAFLGDALLDEMFLTVAPWIAGRDATKARPGFVGGATFDLKAFARLLSVRTAGDHLFLRYGLRRATAAVS